MINKIYFIGDHYRGDQDYNIAILFGLISPLFYDLDIQVEILKDTRRFAHSNRWIGSLIKTGNSSLDEYDLSNTAIIGFEMNPMDITFLNSHHIPWIDFEIHPIRFLNDLHFSIKSSFLFDFESLAASENFIKFVANSIKLRNLNQDFHIEENSLMIVAQSPTDKSVFFDNQFKSLSNYMNSLENIVNQYEHVYFRPHPYLSDIEIGKKVMKSLNATLLNQYSYYDLLSSDKLKAISGISSSCLYEAKYFDKDVFFLENRAKIFSQPIALKNILESSNKWLKAFLQSEENFEAMSFPVQDNLCRDFYGYWSYPHHARPIENSNNALVNTAMQEEEDNTIYYSSSILCNTVKGFYLPEVWGVWARSKAAARFVKVTENLQFPVWIDLKLKLKVFEPLLEYSPVIKISQENEVLAYVFFRRQTQEINEIALRVCCEQDACELLFESTHEASPSQFSSGYNRMLGFGMTVISAEIIMKDVESYENNTNPLIVGIAS